MGLKCTSHPGLRSFDKPCSKIFGFIIWASIPIQQYKNTSGYSTAVLAPESVKYTVSNAYQLHAI